MPIVETENLTHIFPDGTIAIQDISLKINKENLLSLQELLSGNGFRPAPERLTKTHKGSVLIDGKPITENIIEEEESRACFSKSRQPDCWTNCCRGCGFSPKILIYQQTKLKQLSKNH